MDEVSCSDCGAEPAGEETEEELCGGGWDLDGEFGARCPECAVSNAVPDQGEGLAAVAEAAAVKPGKRKRKKKE